MKGCRHLREIFPGEEIEVVEAGLPWNAFIEAYENGRLIYTSLETGFREKYLEHLAKSPSCRREVGITKEDVLRELKRIKRERKNF